MLLLLFFFLGGGGGSVKLHVVVFSFVQGDSVETGVYSKRGTGVLTIYANHPDRNFRHKYKMI